MFNDPVKSYERIIREHGGIVAVKRKGKVSHLLLGQGEASLTLHTKMEVVVDERYVTRVLTDDANFSFELGTADVRALLKAHHGRVRLICTRP